MEKLNVVNRVDVPDSVDGLLVHVQLCVSTDETQKILSWGNTQLLLALQETMATPNTPKLHVALSLQPLDVEKSNISSEQQPPWDLVFLLKVTADKTEKGLEINADMSSLLQTLSETVEKVKPYLSTASVSPRCCSALTTDIPLAGNGTMGIPFELWVKPEVQDWYSLNIAQCDNHIISSSTEWVYRVGPRRVAFLYVIKAGVWITREKRVKDNEVVIFRTDISAVVLFAPPSSGLSSKSGLFDTRVVCVSEYRTPVRNSSNKVVELPGGSSWNPTEGPHQVALEEVHEEAGIELEAARLIPFQSRQLASTLSGHKGHIFYAQLTVAEVATIEGKIKRGENQFGVAEDGEQTTLSLERVGDLLASEHSGMDWSCLGMMMSVLSSVEATGA